MTIHLVQILPDVAQLARFGHSLGLPDADHGYLWHAALRQTFGASAPQPFRVLEPDPIRCSTVQPLRLLGYATADAAALRAIAAHAPAAVASVFPAESIDAKVLPLTAFDPGRRVRFSVRVCPIVRSASSDGSRKRELDAFVHRAIAFPDQPKPDRAAVYRDWLAARFTAGGAILVDAALTRFRLGALVRRSHASPTGRTLTSDGTAKRLSAMGKRAAARRPDATLEGMLEVNDPDRFAELLARGVGRHRAFGFGMLLLRPAG
jgi:CRISPR system Cascade subunit CasE